MCPVSETKPRRHWERLIHSCLPLTHISFSLSHIFLSLKSISFTAKVLSPPWGDCPWKWYVYLITITSLALHRMHTPRAGKNKAGRQEKWGGQCVLRPLIPVAPTRAHKSFYHPLAPGDQGRLCLESCPQGWVKRLVFCLSQGLPSLSSPRTHCWMGWAKGRSCWMVCSGSHCFSSWSDLGGGLHWGILVPCMNSESFISSRAQEEIIFSFLYREYVSPPNQDQF